MSVDEAKGSSEFLLTALAGCPFCGNEPESPYTNNVGESYAKLTHAEGCCLGMGETFRRAHWIPSTAFEAWNIRASAWQPIETIPRDGRRILLAITGVDRAVVGFWNGSEWWTLDGNNWQGRKVTHWQPLPDPPQAEPVSE